MKKLNIKKILVPVDFSNSSMNALQTAVSIAKRHEAMIHLLYVDDSDYDLFKGDHNLKPPKLTQYIKILSQLAKSVINNDNLNCSYASEIGSVTHCILKGSLEIASDLIIMGKNGTNGSSDEYAGTHACQVSEKSRIPVIIVPGSFSKRTIKNILFPVRPVFSVIEKYESIRPFILKTNPSITLLNLRNPEYQNELDIIHRLSLVMKTELEKDKVPLTMTYYFKDNQFAEHVLSVIADTENNYDLAVISTEQDKSNKDFHLGNYAQKIIHKSTIPLLIIHPEQAKLDKDKLLIKLDKRAMLN